MFCFLIVFSLFWRLWSDRKINSKLGFNMVVVGKTRTTLMSFRPESMSIDYVNLPDDLKISLALDGPTFGIRELREVGIVGDESLNNFRRGLSLDLGVVLPIVVRHDGENDLATVREALIDFRKTKTNLGFFDRLETIRLLDIILSKGLNLAQAFPVRLTDRVIELDGKSYQRINDSVYSWTKNFFSSESVLSETAEIAVVNESGQPGIGRKVSRQLETSGMRVIEVKSDETVLDKKCEVSGDGLKHPMTMSYLKKYMDCETVGESSKIQEADLTVVIGKRF
jgi:hypothetical protein